MRWNITYNDLHVKPAHLNQQHNGRFLSAVIEICETMAFSGQKAYRACVHDTA